MQTYRLYNTPATLHGFWLLLKTALILCCSGRSLRDAWGPVTKACQWLNVIIKTYVLIVELEPDLHAVIRFEIVRNSYRDWVVWLSLTCEASSSRNSGRWCTSRSSQRGAAPWSSLDWVGFRGSSPCGRSPSYKDIVMCRLWYGGKSGIGKNVGGMKKCSPQSVHNQMLWIVWMQIWPARSLMRWDAYNSDSLLV